MATETDEQVGYSDFDPLMDFIAYLEETKEPHIGRGGPKHLYASDAGRCARAVYYRHTNDDPPEDDHEPATVIIRAVGTFLHDTYLAMLKLHFPDGVFREIKWAYPDELTPVLTGRCDGVYTMNGKRIALEIKSKSKFQFKRIQDEGVPALDNALQAALSGLVLKTDLVEVVYLCRDWIEKPSEPVLSFRYPTPVRAAKEEITRLLRASRMPEPGKAPATLGEANPKPPPREIGGDLITNPERDKRCMFCAYRDDCEIDGAT